MKICTKCKEEKPLSEFLKDNRKEGRYLTQCKSCRYEHRKQWGDSNPKKIKETNLKNKERRKEFYNDPNIKESYRIKYVTRTYNISEQQYKYLLETQNNKCAICGRDEKSSRNKHLAVDHCHKTGKVRNLLCSHCNRGLGLFHENQQILMNAINYLNKHKNE